MASGSNSTTYEHGSTNVQHIPSSAQARTQPDIERDDFYKNLLSIEDFETRHLSAQQPKLIPIAKVKPNPLHAIRFHDLCQEHGIVPSFAYQALSGQVFKATVTFGNHNLEGDSACASKKLAKEAVCREAIPLLEALKRNDKKRKSSDSDATENAVLRAENWVGMLNNYSQQRKLLAPTYSESRTTSNPTLFSCTLALTGCSLAAPPFGFKERLYPCLTDARRAAAREAVLWLRSQGEVVTDPQAASAKRTMTIPAEPEPGHTGGTQSLAKVDLNGGSDLPMTQQVHNLVASLGLHQPSFVAHSSEPPTVITSNENPGAFVSMAAHFAERDVKAEPRLAGPIGKVERVYGKKKAKELCCREVLQLLLDVERSRQA
ncbi:hypothetical protein BAUCODRAFT_385575 [Baudoinia panamericana UAMH 10762]|uniref:DRBM domain-containing protein n=1 Tax=Baudoinia panamericana (strain UAMH 10762) TaxID=717646 RepID=M2NHV3_BAUPA|nr:uncharacterized protein BAUCODRAFT_385575 [Baudoinia panamericana UAMH 10762]EMC98934.1 hypothetical protein BAUCODRAFT_385575 [Baudoinia panamericana UAMH 10762]